MGIVNFFSTHPQVPGTLIAAVIAAAALRSNRHLTRAKHTLDFEKESSHTNRQLFLKTFDLLRSRSREEIGALGASSRPGPPDQADYTSFIETLNLWEGVAIALRHKVYNETMLFEAYGTTISTFLIHASPFIEARQRDNPRYFQNFVWLGLRWSSWLCDREGFKPALVANGWPTHGELAAHISSRMTLLDRASASLKKTKMRLHAQLNILGKKRLTVKSTRQAVDDCH